MSRRNLARPAHAGAAIRAHDAVLRIAADTVDVGSRDRCWKAGTRILQRSAAGPDSGGPRAAGATEPKLKTMNRRGP